MMDDTRVSLERERERDDRCGIDESETIRMHVVLKTKTAYA
jgi:hypothetical protein